MSLTQERVNKTEEVSLVEALSLLSGSHARGGWAKCICAPGIFARVFFGFCMQGGRKSDVKCDIQTTRSREKRG